MDITYNLNGYQYEVELENVKIETRNLSGGVRYDYVDSYEIYSVNDSTDSAIINLFKLAVIDFFFECEILKAYYNLKELGRQYE